MTEHHITVRDGEVFYIGDRIGPPKDDEYRATGYGVEQMSAMAWMWRNVPRRWVVTVGEGS